MKQIEELLKCINEYSGQQEQAKMIRQLICYISDSVKIKDDDLKELLFEASQLIRVFGYNKLNNINIERIEEENDMLAMRKELVLKEYVSMSSSTMFLDAAQKDVVETFQNSAIKRILVSAPTSFGKTHLLKEIIFRNAERYKNIVLIFPTVALLIENMDSITEFVEEHKLNYVVANTFKESEDEDQRNIFVLTPERAITIFEMVPKIKIDFFFFDEVYKIDEDFNTSDDYEDGEDKTVSIKKKEFLPYSRAVAFRLVLYFLSKYTPEFYLAGPYINLECLGQGMQNYLEKYSVIKKQIDTEATLKTYINAWKNKAEVSNVIDGISTINLEGDYTSKSRKIKAIHNYLVNNVFGTTLVYCDYPSRAVEYAKDIAVNKKSNNIDLIDFVNHLKKLYSIKILKHNNIDSTKKWSFLKVLESGVGVHHGKMPKYVQKEILKFFNDDVLEILFCTSTLIEGVNTKAKNVIVASSNIRNRQQLNQFDLKNIVGRAGRYYHHFLGRVFFIDEKQDEIMGGKDQSLNFSIFDNIKLAAEDFDNVCFEDLVGNNQLIKREREAEFDTKLLPDEIFVKNRLFDRIQQQKFLLELKNKFNEFRKLMIVSYDPQLLLQDVFIKMFLELIFKADIINDKQQVGHLGIMRSYSWGGINGLINYEMNKSEKFKDVDTAYKNVFDKLKTVIEYQIPRYLMLFQAMYNFESILRKTGDNELDLSKVIRFFETGVCSDAGIYLVEQGMPSETVRKIEKDRRFFELSKISKDEGISFLQKNISTVLSYVDKYEEKIIRKLILCNVQ